MSCSNGLEGVQQSDICCAAECETCGGVGCSQRPGGQVSLLDRSIQDECSYFYRKVRRLPYLAKCSRVLHTKTYQWLPNRPGCVQGNVRFQNGIVPLPMHAVSVPPPPLHLRGTPQYVHGLKQPPTPPGFHHPCKVLVVRPL